jgi:hypothetical protein
MDWNRHFQEIYTPVDASDAGADQDANSELGNNSNVVGNVSGDEGEEQSDIGEEPINNVYNNEFQMDDDAPQHPVDEEEGTIIDVAVFDDEWGPKDNRVDSYCFLCQRGETKEEMSKNLHFCKLLSLTRCQLGVSDIKRCRLIQELYKAQFLGKHAKNKPWSLHSIKRHIYEHDSNVEVVSGFVTNIIASQMVRMAETCLCTKQGERGPKMVNLEAMEKFMKMAKAFFDIKAKNAL